jgi:hypothetical protein
MNVAEPILMRLTDFFRDNLVRTKGQVRATTLKETAKAMRDFTACMGDRRVLSRRQKQTQWICTASGPNQGFRTAELFSSDPCLCVYLSRGHRPARDKALQAGAMVFQQTRRTALRGIRDECSRQICAMG